MRYGLLYYTGLVLVGNHTCAVLTFLHYIIARNPYMVPVAISFAVLSLMGSGAPAKAPESDLATSRKFRVSHSRAT